MSESEKTYSVHAYEVQALIAWHVEQKYEAARKELFADAENHKRRIGELTRMVAPAAELEQVWSK